MLWFVQENGELVPKSIDQDGLFRSSVFPGLWLDPASLFRETRRSLRAVVDRGLATAEHADFVARLAAARSSGGPAEP